MDAQFVISGCDLKSLPDSKANLLPCGFDSNVELKTDFFQSSIYSENDNLCASFRGRPLLGQKLNLPNGFICCVVKQKSRMKDNQNKLSISKKFNDFTYWNLDSEPSEDDRVVQALKWANISESIHSMDIS